MKKTVIIGAGISGLALGWLLKRNPCCSDEVVILESADRAGGWIRTIDCEGYRFELGPRSCRPKGNGLYTLRLIEELGIADQVIGGSAEAKKRYLYLNKKLQPLPHNFFTFMTSPLMKGIIPALIKEWRTAPSSWDDETIYSFASRRFGNAVAERFFDPMTSGIYAGDIRQLSVKSCFPILHQLEQEHGSILKGMIFRKKHRSNDHSPFVQEMQTHSLFSFKNGMSTLVEALEKQLGEVIRYHCKVNSLKKKEGMFHITLENGEHFEAEKVYSCIPAYTLAEIIKEDAPSLSDDLRNIETASVSTVSLGYNKRVFPYQGFGHLVPHSEKEDVLGVVWDSSVFPEQNKNPDQTRLTVMIGGKKREDLTALSKQETLDIALDSVQRHLEINAAPDAVHVEFARNAIPQYSVGHGSLVDGIEKKVAEQFTKDFVLLGNNFHGVAVNDCIAQAYESVI